MSKADLEKKRGMFNAMKMGMMNQLKDRIMQQVKGEVMKVMMFQKMKKVDDGCNFRSAPRTPQPEKNSKIYDIFATPVPQIIPNLQFLWKF